MAEALEALELSFACPGCGSPVEGRLDAQTASMTCGTCGRETELPDLEGFLYVKHRGLHADDIAALQAHLDELLDQRTRRKGGEDEHTDPTP